MEFSVYCVRTQEKENSRMSGTYIYTSIQDVQERAVPDSCKDWHFHIISKQVGKVQKVKLSILQSIQFFNT